MGYDATPDFNAFGGGLKGIDRSANNSDDEETAISSQIQQAQEQQDQKLIEDLAFESQAEDRENKRN